jgi:hypothetical protein
MSRSQYLHAYLFSHVLLLCRAVLCSAVPRNVAMLNQETREKDAN